MEYPDEQFVIDDRPTPDGRLRTPVSKGEDAFFRACWRDILNKDPLPLLQQWPGFVDWDISRPEKNSPGMRAYMTGTNYPSPYYMTEDLQCGSPLYVDFVERLKPQLEGISGSDWSILFQVGGLAHDPNGSAPINVLSMPSDAAAAWEEAGEHEKAKAYRQVSMTVDDRHLKLCRSTARVLTRGGRNYIAGVSAKPFSSLGGMVGLKSVVAKAALARMWFLHGPDIMSCAARGDDRGLRSYGLSNVAFDGSRHQPDAPEKKRIVYSNGRWVVSDRRISGDLCKTLGLDDRCQDWLCDRFRIIRVEDGVTAWPLRGISQALAKMKKKKWPAVFGTLVHSTITARSREIPDPELVDETNHDSFCPYPALEIFADALEEEFGPGPAYLWRALNHPLIISRNDVRFGKGYKAHGDPTLFIQDNFPGNPSGHPGTKEQADFLAVFYELVSLFDQGLIGDEEEDVEAFLSWQLNPDFRMSINGDNRIRSKRNRLIKPYGQTSEAQSFSGLVWDKETEEYETNDQTFILGWTLPGRSALDPMRGSVYVGAEQRVRSYAQKNPRIDSYMVAFDACWRDVFGVTFSDHCVEARRHVNLPEPTSLADAAVLYDPDVILWGKFDIAEVSPDLRIKLFYHQPEAEVRHSLALD